MTAVFNTQSLKTIQWNTNVYAVTKIVNISLMKSERNHFLIYTKFLITTIISLFCKKVFINKNIWMTGKTSVKQYYLKKEDFHSRLNVEDLTDADYVHVRRVCKDFEIKNLGEFHDLYV